MLLLHNKTTGDYLLLSDDYELINLPSCGILKIDGQLEGYNLVCSKIKEVSDVDESEISNNK